MRPRTAVGAVIGAALIAGAAYAPAATAGGNVGFGVWIGAPGFGVAVGNYGYGYVAPAYISPPPAYVAPAPLYVAPRPIYVAPLPVYVAPRPVNLAPYRAWHGHRYHAVARPFAYAGY